MKNVYKNIIKMKSNCNNSLQIASVKEKRTFQSLPVLHVLKRIEKQLIIIIYIINIKLKGIIEGMEEK